MEQFNEIDLEYIRQFNKWEKGPTNNDGIKIGPIGDYVINPDGAERIIVLDKWCGFIKIPVPQRIF